MTEAENKIKVFASDDNLKSLGELLSNETSRKIIMNLMNNEMYTNEIATKLDIRVSLVIHHLRKLEELGLVEIVDKKIKRKGEKHRFFKMNFDIFITLDKNKEDVDKKGILKRIFRDGIKFTSIGLAAIISYIIPQQFYSKNTWSVLDNMDELSIELPLIIIIIGLAMGRIYSYFKNKKKM